MIQTKHSSENQVDYSQKDFFNCWHLRTDNGRQYWEFKIPDCIKNQKDFDEDDFLKKMGEAFKFDKAINPNASDLVYRTKVQKSGKDFIDNTISLREKAENAYLKGFDFYQNLQTADGNWPGDYGGPNFLLPGLIIVSYITQTPFEKPVEKLMVRYMLNHQNKDGGWGLHIEGKSTMFGTVLQYVALRLLGEEADNPALQKAQHWIISHGGATEIPLWGKFYLTVLGIYEWEGNNSFYPEAWILPEALPIHPSRYWNHARMVYMPMSYCYAVKLKGKNTPLLESLKQEIYTQAYEEINWKKAKDSCCEVDLYYKPSKLLNVANVFLNFYEKYHFKSLRNKTINFLKSYIDAEDRHTNYINVGPVNQVLNSLCVWHIHGKNSEEFKKHVDRWKDYLWLAEDGIKMNGYNGSQLWDTAFAAQALLSNDASNHFPEMTEKMYRYFDYTQIKKNEDDYDTFYRDNGFGCWPFSTRDHDWPITDCTAEGIKCVLGLNKTNVIQNKIIQKVELERLKPAIDFLLKMQNKDGGWATYENIRGSKWLEKLNPAHIFNDIMVEYSYVECSSSTMQALKKFHAIYPNYRGEEIVQSLEKGKQFIHQKQRKDGSWYGSWAVCFTYAAWFGIDGLKAAGAKDCSTSTPDKSIIKACEFLVSKQNEDGSWGESFESCVQQKYIPHPEGQIINTAWACLALLTAKYPDKNVIEKGIQFLIDQQETTGDWRQQSISGVFNANCMITYTSYRNVFPLWALGKYLSEE